MKKSTLNALMTSLIICLSIAIIVLIIKIQLRPKTMETQETGQIDISEIASEEVVIPPSESEEPSEKVEVVKRAKIKNDNINVRSGPGTDFERLGAAYGGYNFELIEQLPEGWTKIVYDNKEAYVYSEYVEIVDMVLDENGEYTEYIP